MTYPAPAAASSRLIDAPAPTDPVPSSETEWQVKARLAGYATPLLRAWRDHPQFPPVPLLDSLGGAGRRLQEQAGWQERLRGLLGEVLAKTDAPANPFDDGLSPRQQAVKAVFAAEETFRLLHLRDLATAALQVVLWHSLIGQPLFGEFRKECGGQQAMLAEIYRLMCQVLADRGYGDEPGDAEAKAECRERAAFEEEGGARS